jgi:hypothetical protein
MFAHYLGPDYDFYCCHLFNLFCCIILTLVLDPMSFQTDKAWPAGLLTIFEHGRARHTTFENRYYGPYNKLLSHCFGSGFYFYVAPQSPPRDDRRDTVDFIVFLVVFDSQDKPVFLLEVKDDGWAQKAELRYRADIHIRDRYALMLDECPIPRLWGLSALGTSVRVYCGGATNYQVTPTAISRPQPSYVLLPSFLAGEWDMDILSQEGFEKMKEIVNDILVQTGNVNV